MGYLYPRSVWLRPAVAAVATVTLASTIVGGMIFTRDTPTGGASGPSNAVVTYKGSGAQVGYVDTLGNSTISGSYIQELNNGNEVNIGSGALARGACVVYGDDDTAATTGAVVPFRMLTLSGDLIDVKAFANVAGSAATITVSLGTVNALSTNLFIDEDETSSDTSATGAVILTSADGKEYTEEIAIEITKCGDTNLGGVCGKGIQVCPVFMPEMFAY